jgi:CheY-like chemotaxis protein
MKKVLIVDDEHEVANLIKETLDEEKLYETMLTFSSLEAIEILKGSHFDLVITDMIMPDLNGIELTEHIYSNYPKVKVLACSGGGDSGKLVAGMALDQALEEGADNALLKPFTTEELLTKVKNLI